MIHEIILLVPLIVGILYAFYRMRHKRAEAKLQEIELKEKTTLIKAREADKKSVEDSLKAVSKFVNKDVQNSFPTNFEVEIIETKDPKFLLKNKDKLICRVPKPDSAPTMATIFMKAFADGYLIKYKQYISPKLSTAIDIIFLSRALKKENRHDVDLYLIESVPNDTFTIMEDVKKLHEVKLFDFLFLPLLDRLVENNVMKYNVINTDKLFDFLKPEYSEINDIQKKLKGLSVPKISKIRFAFVRHHLQDLTVHKVQTKRSFENEQFSDIIIDGREGMLTDAKILVDYMINEKVASLKNETKFDNPSQRYGQYYGWVSVYPQNIPT